MRVYVEAVLVGTPRPLGPGLGPSSIHTRRPVAGPVAFNVAGLVGDAVGDRKHHGRTDKAIHHYPRDHYAVWLREMPERSELLAAPGAFGENLSTTGLTEENVHVGDVLRLGTGLVQISQARQPCYKLNRRFEEGTMSRRVQDARRTGWYYRVLEAGRVEAGDGLELVERPVPGWSLAEVLEVFYGRGLDLDRLSALAELEPLAESWRELARRRIEQRRVESWTSRLYGRAGRAQGSGARKK